MSSRRTRAQKQRAAQARRATAESSPTTIPESEQDSTELRPAPAKPVKVSVPLHPDEYHALKRYALDVSAAEGLALVAGAEVVRALLALLHTDPDLAARVRAQLAATGGNRRGPDARSGGRSEGSGG